MREAALVRRASDAIVLHRSARHQPWWLGPALVIGMGLRLKHTEDAEAGDVELHRWADDGGPSPFRNPWGATIVEAGKALMVEAYAATRSGASTHDVSQTFPGAASLIERHAADILDDPDETEGFDWERSFEPAVLASDRASDRTRIGERLDRIFGDERPEQLRACLLTHNVSAGPALGLWSCSGANDDCAHLPRARCRAQHASLPASGASRRTARTKRRGRR